MRAGRPVSRTVAATLGPSSGQRPPTGNIGALSVATAVAARPGS